jgi:hypothetical protein
MFFIKDFSPLNLKRVIDSFTDYQNYKYNYFQETLCARTALLHCTCLGFDRYNGKLSALILTLLSFDSFYTLF